MPIRQPVSEESLVPPPDPYRHQRYEEFRPQKFYIEHLQEFRWQYHSDPPYSNNGGSLSWGFDGMTPGPTYHARYGEPVFVRRYNDIPPVGQSRVTFALPSTTIHLHNAHTASESDGLPFDYADSGEFWDHQYCNFPAGFDKREVMSTLWYHDHREEFTAANVYAGLSGFYLLFDEHDTGNENDESPKAWRLPSGEFDVPLILHDVLFDADGEVVFDSMNTDGILGDRFTVNRIIQPYFEVQRRKYRFRLLNGGPSRFYELYLNPGDNNYVPFTVLSNDGNMLPRPLQVESLNMSVAQRHDVIIDFSQFEDGTDIILENRLEQLNGRGPTGRLYEPGQGDNIMQFRVRGPVAEDPSRVPRRLRELPPIRMKEVKRERLWVFDYDGGLWTVNGRIFDPNRIDAGIEQGTAEIWTIRNAGSTWSHPVHIHFEEHQILEKNGEKISEGDLLRSRKDVMTLGPGDEIKIFMRWRDFLGRHVMHCHNVVHEDHAMMIRWDIVPPGQGF